MNSSNKINRNVHGFDSFEGLPYDDDGHPRWNEGLFKINHSSHPIFKIGDEVTVEKVYESFDKLQISKPSLIKSYFDELNIDYINKIALVHVDCDLYSSTITLLNLIKDKLETGSIIMFDDWFNYKGDKNKGVRKAFNEFLIKNTHIQAEEFLRYGTWCKAFIITFIK